MSIPVLEADTDFRTMVATLGQGAGGGASAYRCDRHRQKMPLPSSVDAQPSRKAGEAERQPVPAMPLPGTVVVELAEEAAAAKDQESGRSERV